MSITRYYTIGAVAEDVGMLKELGERLEVLGVTPEALILLLRRRDEPLVRNILPGARTRTVESGLSRMQWIELASAYLGVTAVSVLMGAVHLLTGIVVQAAVTLAVAIGLVLYYRSPQLEKKLARMALPERLADEWAKVFSSRFALVLATVPEELFDEARDAFLEDASLESPLAVDQRPVW